MKLLGSAALGLITGALLSSAGCCYLPSLPDGEFGAEAYYVARGLEPDVHVVIDDDTVTESWTRNGKKYVMQYKVTGRYQGP